MRKNDLNVTITVTANATEVNKNQNYKHSVTKDYNGRPIPEGYVMVPTIPDKLDIELNVKNPECIITLRIPGTGFYTKAVLKAVPAEFETEARRQYNSWQNDQLNQVRKAGKVVAFEILEDEFGLEVPSLVSDTLDNTICGKINSEDAIRRICNECPQLGAGLIFDSLGYEGKDFNEKMRISATQACQVKKEVQKIFETMLHEDYMAVDSIKKNKTKNDGYYRQVIKENLSTILEILMVAYESI